MTPKAAVLDMPERGEVAPKAETANPNMQHWRAMARPPVTALKTIRGGRLQGMTDVNPQWRYQAMTEQFGLAGFIHFDEESNFHWFKGGGGGTQNPRRRGCAYGQAVMRSSACVVSPAATPNMVS